MSSSSSPITGNNTNNSNISSIHHSNRNPVLKIPIIHRIFYFAASDVVKCEELSRVCFPFREALEIYGKAVFANFASRESKEFFRFFYELCEWCEDTWMIEMMIDSWNENFAQRPEYLQEQDEREYGMTDKMRKEFESSSKGKTMRVVNTLFDSESGIERQKKIQQQLDREEKERRDRNNVSDFFNCPGMNRCFQEHACAPTHLAARFDRHDVLRVLLEKGADVNQRDAHGYLAINISQRHESERCVFVLLGEHRRQYYRDLVFAKKTSVNSCHQEQDESSLVEEKEEEEEDQQKLIRDQMAADRKLILHLSEDSEKQYLRFSTAASSSDTASSCFEPDEYLAYEGALTKVSHEIDRSLDLGMHLRRWYSDQPERRKPKNVPTDEFDLFLFSVLHHFLFLTKEGEKEEAKRENSFNDGDSSATTTTFTFQKPKDIFENPSSLSSSSSVAITLTKKEWEEFTKNSAHELRTCMMAFSRKMFPIVTTNDFDDDNDDNDDDNVDQWGAPNNVGEW